MCCALADSSLWRACPNISPTNSPLERLPPHRTPNQSQEHHSSLYTQGGNPLTALKRGALSFSNVESEKGLIRVLPQGRAATQQGSHSRRLAQTQTHVREQQKDFKHTNCVLSPFACPAATSHPHALVAELSCSPTHVPAPSSPHNKSVSPSPTPAAQKTWKN